MQASAGRAIGSRVAPASVEKEKPDWPLPLEPHPYRCEPPRLPRFSARTLYGPQTRRSYRLTLAALSTALAAAGADPTAAAIGAAAWRWGGRARHLEPPRRDGVPPYSIGLSGDKH